MLDRGFGDGIGAFLFGAIILVFGAVGLTLVLDRTFQIEQSENELRANIVANDDQLATLRRQLTEKQNQFQTSRSEYARNEAHFEILSENLTHLKARMEEADGLRQNLILTISEKERELEQLLSTIRRWLARHSTHEPLGGVSLPNGSRLTNASILEVTDNGITLQHSEGTSFIQAKDLPRPLQQRFLWDAAKNPP